MTIEVPATYTYLDYAATAPLSHAAARAMQPYVQPGLANVALGMNANSLHAPGRAAFEAMELARRSIARDLGCSRPNEIIFTSGATEADNMALFGIAHASAQVRRKRDGASTQYRIVTSAIEHEAVLQPAHALQREGFEVQFVKPNREGFITLDALQEAIDEHTVLVSIQTANSELGSIQDIRAFAECAHAHGALFHTDATQALGKLPLNLQDLGVDAASFSAHKVGGPKGVGALYLKARTPVTALLMGGGQEDGRRSSTQNVAGIVGFAAACHEVVQNEASESQRQRELRDWLYERIQQLPHIRPTLVVPQGSTHYLPNIVHALAQELESETLILRLDNAGFGVSGGSACSSHSLEPSAVLRAIGIHGDEVYGALRISFGSYTTKEDLQAFVDALAACLGA